MLLLSHFFLLQDSSSFFLLITRAHENKSTHVVFHTSIDSRPFLSSPAYSESLSNMYGRREKYILCSIINIFFFSSGTLVLAWVMLIYLFVSCSLKKSLYLSFWLVSPNCTNPVSLAHFSIHIKQILCVIVWKGRRTYLNTSYSNNFTDAPL